MDTFRHSAHRIFISHSSEDDAFGSQLLRDLRVFFEEEDAVWYDVRGLNGGDTWWRKIVQEITERDTFIIILSPAAMKSKWVQDEINLAWKQKNTPSGKHIIPLLYQPCQVPDDLDTLQTISFLPPQKYEVAFGELLVALGLPVIVDAERVTTIPLDLGGVILEQMENAFNGQDWATVIRKAEYLVNRLPKLVTMDVYRMQGIALLQQGEVQPALDALDATMALTNDSQYCLRLLGEYSRILGSYEEWESVLYCTTEALKLAPHDADWRTGHQYAQQKVQEITDQAQDASEERTTSPTQPQAEGGDRGDTNDVKELKSINDLFEMFLANSQSDRHHGNEQRGEDIRYEMTITFEEAVFGCQKECDLLRWETCATCQGRRTKVGTSTSRCSTCQGTGQIRRVQQSSFGQFNNVSQCSTCYGKGQVPVTPCETCQGRGRVRNKRRTVVNIPAGVDDGINVRVTGEGHVSEYGGKPGNLYVVLTVPPHPVFKREGTTIIYELHISFTQAVLGDKVEIPTIQGTSIRLKIPAGTKQGSSFLFKGMGVPVVHSSERGDQRVVVVEIMVPTKLTVEQEYLIRELARVEHRQNEQNEKHIFRALYEKAKDVLKLLKISRIGLFLLVA